MSLLRWVMGIKTIEHIHTDEKVAVTNIGPKLEN